jgi:ribosomal protein S15P/S13E
MKGEAESITEEEWRVLEHKIKVFQEHVKGFQKDVEKRLKRSR